jgi:hypothetical protein
LDIFLKPRTDQYATLSLAILGCMQIYIMLTRQAEYLCSRNVLSIGGHMSDDLKSKTKKKRLPYILMECRESGRLICGNILIKTWPGL